MKIVLYFGSFNPIHNGHLIIANHVLNTMDIGKLWFVVSPQNPFKKEADLLKESDRLMLIQAAVQQDERILVSDIEFHLPKPSYTIHTLEYLKEKYAEYEFSILMGSDSFKDIRKWKNFESILDGYSILVYRRPGHEIENKLPASIEILDAPLLEISSTSIRELIKHGKSIRYLVPEKVREEIERNQFYS